MPTEQDMERIRRRQDQIIANTGGSAYSRDTGSSCWVSLIWFAVDIGICAILAHFLGWWGAILWILLSVSIAFSVNAAKRR